MRRTALAGLTLVLALGWLGGGDGLAHENYPFDCCSGHDCRPAESGEIELMADGRYLVVPTGETFTRSQVRPSFDARFHRCLYNPADPRSRTFCVLVPAGS